jgi:hypothetical protein
MGRVSILRDLFTPKIVIGALALGLILFLGVILILNLTKPTQTPLGLVTAALTVIPAPTATPIPPTATPPQATQNPDLPPEPSPGEIAVGNYVQVFGTEGDGLRLRLGPGLDYDPQYLGLEGEVFQVLDGPQQVDGYTWWLLAAPLDADRQGWGVSNFLLVVQNP